MRSVHGAYSGFSIPARAPLESVRFACASVIWFAASILPAQSDEPTDLLFFSADLMSQRSYAGAGWLHAVRGLDFSGPVFSAELGRSQWNSADGQVAWGWRFVDHGVWLTLLGGVEAVSQSTPSAKPVGSVDFWWEPSHNWMASAQIQAAPDYLSWRTAIGVKMREDGPWVGPEAGSSANEPRFGVHVTGIEFSDGFEARASAGISWRCDFVGPYGELSIWRRF
jgi:hypothetical protein